jgi:hypothetical protein
MLVDGVSLKYIEIQFFIIWAILLMLNNKKEGVSSNYTFMDK